MNNLPKNYEVLVISVIFCNIEIVAKEMELHMNEIIKDFNENWIQFGIVYADCCMFHNLLYFNNIIKS